MIANFLQFHLYRESKVQILKENEVPEEPERVLEYEFTSIPDVDAGDPPLSPSLMAHWYYAPEHTDDDTMCLNAFPKRRFHHLTYESGVPKVGWGIYLKEGPSEVFFLIMKLAFIASIGIIFGVAWNSLHHDDQKSFPWSVVAWIGLVVFAVFDLLNELLKGQYEISVSKGKAKAD